MKKKLESELISIAHRILKLKGKEDVNRLHEEVAQLYEKLTVLKFAQDNFDEQIPTIGNDSSFFGMLDAAFNNKVGDNIEIENHTYINMDEREDDGIMEPVMNKIKDMMAFMPDESTKDEILEASEHHQKEIPEIAVQDIPKAFETIPSFEPIEDAKNRESMQQKKSLNDRLKNNGLQIGLNDKLAFIKHLFDGEAENYNRVISQLNTTNNLQEAKTFINTLVKPDYNNWTDKDDYELRFMEIIEGKFE